MEEGLIYGLIFDLLAWYTFRSDPPTKNEGPERNVIAAVLDSKDLDLSSLPQDMAKLQSEGVNFVIEISVLRQ